jgi:hypothetical protein
VSACPRFVRGQWMPSRWVSLGPRSGLWLVLTCLMVLLPPAGQAQPVVVTLSLETNQISVGATTTLRALAQIIPAQRPNTDQIFSWYVDLLNASNSVAALNRAQIKKSSSDQNPRTSSSGTVDGPNLRGIFDTFLNAPGAGQTGPVELFSVPVQGLKVGKTTFQVQAGTGVAGLTADFIVAPAAGGDPLLGGDYTLATAQLEVVAPASELRLTITQTPLSPVGQRLILTFPATPGQTHNVQFRNDLDSGPDWQSLPGAPYNSGQAFDTNSRLHRFYRLQVTD